MMQYRRWLIAAVLVVAASSMFAEDVQEQVKKMEMDRAVAVVNADIATLVKTTSDDYVLINMNGRMTGKSDMIAGFKSGSSKITAEELSDLKVRVYGDTAVVTGKADVKGTLAGADATGQILFTRVWVKKDGSWQSTSLQQTRAKN